MGWEESGSGYRHRMARKRYRGPFLAGLFASCMIYLISLPLAEKTFFFDSTGMLTQISSSPVGVRDMLLVAKSNGTAVSDYVVTDTMSSTCRVSIGATSSSGNPYFVEGINGTCADCKTGCLFDKAGLLPKSATAGKEPEGYCESEASPPQCSLDLGMGDWANEMFFNLTAEASPSEAQIKKNNYYLHNLQRYKFLQFAHTDSPFCRGQDGTGLKMADSGELCVGLFPSPYFVKTEEHFLGIKNMSGVDFQKVGAQHDFLIDLLNYIQGVFFPALVALIIALASGFFTCFFCIARLPCMCPACFCCFDTAGCDCTCCLQYCREGSKTPCCGMPCGCCCAMCTNWTCLHVFAVQKDYCCYSFPCCICAKNLVVKRKLKIPKAGIDEEQLNRSHVAMMKKSSDIFSRETAAYEVFNGGLIVFDKHDEKHKGEDGIPGTDVMYAPDIRSIIKYELPGCLDGHSGTTSLVDIIYKRLEENRDLPHFDRLQMFNDEKHKDSLLHETSDRGWSENVKAVRVAMKNAISDAQWHEQHFENISARLNREPSSWLFVANLILTLTAIGVLAYEALIIREIVTGAFFSQSYQTRVVLGTGLFWVPAIFFFVAALVAPIQRGNIRRTTVTVTVQGTFDKEDAAEVAQDVAADCALALNLESYMDDACERNSHRSFIQEDNPAASPLGDDADSKQASAKSAAARKKEKTFKGVRLAPDYLDKLQTGEIKATSGALILGTREADHTAATITEAGAKSKNKVTRNSLAAAAALSKLAAGRGGYAPSVNKFVERVALVPDLTGGSFKVVVNEPVSKVVMKPHLSWFKRLYNDISRYDIHCSNSTGRTWLQQNDGNQPYPAVTDVELDVDASSGGEPPRGAQHDIEIIGITNTEASFDGGSDLVTVKRRSDGKTFAFYNPQVTKLAIKMEMPADAANALRDLAIASPNSQEKKFADENPGEKHGLVSKMALNESICDCQVELSDDSGDVAYGGCSPFGLICSCFWCCIQCCECPKSLTSCCAGDGCLCPCTYSVMKCSPAEVDTQMREHRFLAAALDKDLKKLEHAKALQRALEFNDVTVADERRYMDLREKEEDRRSIFAPNAPYFCVKDVAQQITFLGGPDQTMMRLVDKKVMSARHRGTEPIVEGHQYTVASYVEVDGVGTAKFSKYMEMENVQIFSRLKVLVDADGFKTVSTYPEDEHTVRHSLSADAEPARHTTNKDPNEIPKEDGVYLIVSNQEGGYVSGRRLKEESNGEIADGATNVQEPVIAEVTSHYKRKTDKEISVHKGQTVTVQMKRPDGYWMVTAPGSGVAPEESGLVPEANLRLKSGLWQFLSPHIDGLLPRELQDIRRLEKQWAPIMLAGERNGCCGGQYPSVQFCRCPCGEWTDWCCCFDVGCGCCDMCWPFCRKNMFDYERRYGNEPGYSKCQARFLKIAYAATVFLCIGGAILGLAGVRFLSCGFGMMATDVILGVEGMLGKIEPVVAALQGVSGTMAELIRMSGTIVVNQFGVGGIFADGFANLIPYKALVCSATKSTCSDFTAMRTACSAGIVTDCIGGVLQYSLDSLACWEGIRVVMVLLVGFTLVINPLVMLLGFCGFGPTKCDCDFCPLLEDDESPFWYFICDDQYGSCYCPFQRLGLNIGALFMLLFCVCCLIFLMLWPVSVIIGDMCVMFEGLRVYGGLEGWPGNPRADQLALGLNYSDAEGTAKSFPTVCGPAGMVKPFLTGTKDTLKSAFSALCLSTGVMCSLNIPSIRQPDCCADMTIDCTKADVCVPGLSPSACCPSGDDDTVVPNGMSVCCPKKAYVATCDEQIRNVTSTEQCSKENVTLPGGFSDYLAQTKALKMNGNMKAGCPEGAFVLTDFTNGDMGLATDPAICDYTQWPTASSLQAVCQVTKNTIPLPTATPGTVCTDSDETFCYPTSTSGILEQKCGKDNSAAKVLTCSVEGGYKDAYICLASRAGKSVSSGSNVFTLTAPLSGNVRSSNTTAVGGQYYVEDNQVELALSQTAQTTTNYVCGTGNHPDWLGQKAPYVMPTCNGGAGTCSTKCLGDPAAGASAGACVCGVSQGTCTVPDIAFPKTCAEFDEQLCDTAGLAFSGGVRTIASRTPFGLTKGVSKTTALHNAEWVFDTARSKCVKQCDWEGAASNGITNAADASTTRKASIKTGNCETACLASTNALVCENKPVLMAECAGLSGTGPGCYSPLLTAVSKGYVLGVRASEQMENMFIQGFERNATDNQCAYPISCAAGRVLADLVNCGYVELLAQIMEGGMCTYLGWGLVSLSASYMIFMASYALGFLILVLGYKRWNADYQEKNVDFLDNIAEDISIAGGIVRRASLGGGGKRKSEHNMGTSTGVDEEEVGLELTERQSRRRSRQMSITEADLAAGLPLTSHDVSEEDEDMSKYEPQEDEVGCCCLRSSSCCGACQCFCGAYEDTRAFCASSIFCCLGCLPCCRCCSELKLTSIRNVHGAPKSIRKIQAVTKKMMLQRALGTAKTKPSNTFALAALAAKSDKDSQLALPQDDVSKMPGFGGDDSARTASGKTAFDI